MKRAIQIYCLILATLFLAGLLVIFCGEDLGQPDVPDYVREGGR